MEAVPVVPTADLEDETLILNCLDNAVTVLIDIISWMFSRKTSQRAVVT